LEDEDIGPFYAPTWQELNCLETLIDIEERLEANR
jgi:hypothetical protein